MEKKIEKIIMHKGGKQMTVEVCEEPDRYQGRRAYIPGDTRYWDMDQLDKAIAGCDSVERIAL